MAGRRGVKTLPTHALTLIIGGGNIQHRPRSEFVGVNGASPVPTISEIMLIPTILVTIRGPLKTLDLELQGDVSVGELIPLLLEMCGSQENDSQEFLQASISLQVAGTRAPLSADKTLIDAGVYDGAVLILQMKHPLSTLAERPAPQQFAPKSVQPGTNTGGIGVTWKALG